MAIGLTSGYSDSVKAIYLHVLIEKSSASPLSFSNYASLYTTSLSGQPSTGKDYPAILEISEFSRSIAGFGITPQSSMEISIASAGPSESSSIYQSLYGDLFNSGNEFRATVRVYYDTSGSAPAYSSLEVAFLGYVENVQSEWGKLSIRLTTSNLREDATLPPYVVEDGVSEGEEIPVKSKGARIPMVYGPWDYIPMVHIKTKDGKNYFVWDTENISPAPTRPSVFTQVANKYLPFNPVVASLTYGAVGDLYANSVSFSPTSLWNLQPDLPLNFSSAGTLAAYKAYNWEAINSASTKDTWNAIRYDSTQQKVAFKYTPAVSGPIRRIRIKNIRIASTYSYTFTWTNGIRVSIAADSSGVPGSTITNGDSDYKDPNDILAGIMTFSFDELNPPSVTGSTTYWIVVDADFPLSTTNHLEYLTDTSAGGVETRDYNGTDWTTYTYNAYAYVDTDLETSSAYSVVTDIDHAFVDDSTVTSDLYTGGTKYWLAFKMPEIPIATKVTKCQFSVRVESGGDAALANWEAYLVKPDSSGEVGYDLVSSSLPSGVADRIAKGIISHATAKSSVGGTFIFTLDKQKLYWDLNDGTRVGYYLVDQELEMARSEIGIKYLGTTTGFGVEYCTLYHVQISTEKGISTSEQMYIEVGGDEDAFDDPSLCTRGSLYKPWQILEDIISYSSSLGASVAIDTADSDNLFLTSESFAAEQADHVHCGLNSYFFLPNVTSGAQGDSLSATVSVLATPFQTESTAKNVEAVYAFLSNTETSWGDQTLTMEIYTNGASVPGSLVTGATRTLNLYDGTLPNYERMRSGKGWYQFKFSSPVSLSNSTTYWLRLTRGGTWTNALTWYWSSKSDSSFTLNAKEYVSSTWFNSPSPVGTGDYYFASAIRETRVDKISGGLGSGYRKKETRLIQELDNIGNQLNYRVAYDENMAWQLRVIPNYGTSTTYITFNQNNIIEMESVTLAEVETVKNNLTYYYRYHLQKKDFANSIRIRDLISTPNSGSDEIVEADWVHVGHQARWHAFLRYLYQYKRKLKISFKTDSTGINLEAGDLIKVNHPLFYGYSSAIIFEVTSLSVNILSNTVKINALEYIIPSD